MNPFGVLSATQDVVRRGPQFLPQAVHRGPLLRDIHPFADPRVRVSSISTTGVRVGGPWRETMPARRAKVPTATHHYHWEMAVNRRRLSADSSQPFPVVRSGG
jgi:hypothetical protein